MRPACGGKPRQRLSGWIPPTPVLKQLLSRFAISSVTSAWHTRAHPTTSIGDYPTIGRHPNPACAIAGTFTPVPAKSRLPALTWLVGLRAHTAPAKAYLEPEHLAASAECTSAPTQPCPKTPTHQLVPEDVQRRNGWPSYSA